MRRRLVALQNLLYNAALRSDDPNVCICPGRPCRQRPCRTRKRG